MGRNWGETGEKDFRVKLTAINENLDSVKLRVKDGKIYIRGTFPPRPGETENVRTDLATGCSANHAGLRVAKMKAEDINLQLLNDRFDWTPFLKGRLKHLKPASTIGEWLPLYEEHHWQKNDRSNVITTWVIASGNIFATVSFHLPRWTFVMPMPDECIARGLILDSAPNQWAIAATFMSEFTQLGGAMSRIWSGIRRSWGLKRRMVPC